MSQRLLISKEENINLEKDAIYDCIYTEKSNSNNLLYEWCAYNDQSGTFLGPWKIRIRDMELMDQFAQDFKELGNHIYPLQSFDDVWTIYNEEGEIVHVSKKEADKYEFIVKNVIDHINSQGGPR